MPPKSPVKRPQKPQMAPLLKKVETYFSRIIQVTMGPLELLRIAKQIPQKSKL
jgi:hypothetical protein